MKPGTPKNTPEKAAVNTRPAGSSRLARQFQTALMAWHRTENNRQMPWKGEKDPYRIWLSEIILQQTRVEQGWAYYLRFIEQFPTVEALAQAPDNEVFKLWEGLGYYSRCRNLLAAARSIVSQWQGQFPRKYPDILGLQGVGPYTAAAIASFAFGLPHAVVDGNVVRILARYFGIREAFDTSAGKKRFMELAQQLLHLPDPGAYNQAIMDFGATVCKPAAPACNQCPLRSACVAVRENAVDQYPVKEKKLVRKTRWFCYLIISAKQGTLVRRRETKDIWQGLHEFVLLEDRDAFEWSNSQLEQWMHQHLGLRATVVSRSAPASQQLTHQTVHARFIQAGTKNAAPPEGFHWASDAQISNMAFPRIIRHFLQQDQEPMQASLF